MSRWFEVGPCGVPLLRVLEDSRARDHLLEKIGAFASHGFPSRQGRTSLGGPEACILSCSRGSSTLHPVLSHCCTHQFKSTSR